MVATIQDVKNRSGILNTELEAALVGGIDQLSYFGGQS